MFEESIICRVMLALVPVKRFVADEVACTLLAAAGEYVAAYMGYAISVPSVHVVSAEFETKTSEVFTLGSPPTTPSSVIHKVHVPFL